MDKELFSITVISLFGGGVNEQFLASHVKYKTIFPKEFPGNSHVMKILSPEVLHKICVKEKYDIEISYLEGPSARVISGCKDKRIKLITWIHVEQHTKNKVSKAFRNYSEAQRCYSKFHRVICVSEYVKKDFSSIINLDEEPLVLYNTNETDQIIHQSKELVNFQMNHTYFNICAMGSLKKSKGFDRLIRIMNKLKKDNMNVRLYLLGKGPEENVLKKQVQDLNLIDNVIFLGYQTNPYKYMGKMDLFVCSSYAEGFSTAATEALVLGIPIVTVLVSGMEEMLGYNNEYGIICRNEENELYYSLKNIIIDKELYNYYKKQAALRGKSFSKEKTVSEVENMLNNL